MSFLLNADDLTSIQFRGILHWRKSISVRSVSADSRNVLEGALFVALRGERFDGHDFLPQVIQQKPSCLLLSTAWVRKNIETVRAWDVPIVAVDDTVKSLGALASLYRQKFTIPVIAVGGSNGKTTTKNMIRSVLSRKFNIVATQGNHNNHIGVPMTLFGIRKRHDIAVVEIGTNHFGEIEYLCEILRPTHGLVTSVGNEHLEFFGSIDGVAREETTLIRWLRTQRGSRFFLNRDDAYLRKAVGKLESDSYSLKSDKADVQAKILSRNHFGACEVEIRRKRGKKIKIQLSLPGAFNAQNALAAATVGFRFGVSQSEIRGALERFRGSDKRSEVLRKNGLLVLNDSYNANPDSMLASLDSLRGVNVKGRRIAVLGDMKELGEQSAMEHARVGAEGMEGIDALFTYGTFAAEILKSARVKAKQHFQDKSELIAYLRKVVKSGDAVLVKGSRGMKMEEVAQALLSTA